MMMNNGMHSVQYKTACVQQVQQVQHNALKQVKIHSSAKSAMVPGEDWNPFTLYTLTVSCPATKTWWTVKKRYSTFLAMYQKLRAMYKRVSKATKWNDVGPILQPIIKMKFPKRYMRVDNDQIILERKQGFQHFLKKLIAIRAECFVYALRVAHQETTTLPNASSNMDVVLDLVNEIYETIQEFLEMPDIQKDEELRQALTILSPDVAATVLPCHEQACCDIDHSHITAEPCSICLCEFESHDNSKPHAETSYVDNVLKLPCGHCFHEDCVIQWFDKNGTCPLCRAEASSGTML